MAATIASTLAVQTTSVVAGFAGSQRQVTKLQNLRNPVIAGQVRKATVSSRAAALKTFARAQKVENEVATPADSLSPAANAARAVLTGAVGACLALALQTVDISQALAAQSEQVVRSEVSQLYVVAEAEMSESLGKAVEGTSPSAQEAIKGRVEKVQGDKQTSFLATFPPTVLLLTVVTIGGTGWYLAQLFGPAKK